MILTGAVSVWVPFRWVGIPTAGAPSSEAAAAVEEMEKEGVGEAGIRVQANKTKDGGVEEIISSREEEEVDSGGCLPREEEDQKEVNHRTRTIKTKKYFLISLIN